MAIIKMTELIEMPTATAIVGPLIVDWFGTAAKLDADADVDVGLELMLWPKLVDAELGKPVAAHEQISAPTDETWRPFSTPQACRMQSMAVEEMSACFAGSHEHCKSSTSHPTLLPASSIQDR